MVVTAGSFNRVGPQIHCTGCRSLTQIAERPSALPVQSLGPPMAVTPGRVKPAERPMASWPFHLLMPTRELLLARMAQLLERQTEETTGSTKPVERQITSTPFHLPMQITEHL